MKKYSLILSALILMTACNPGGHLNSDGKADLKVLYVGGSPDIEAHTVNKSKAEIEESVVSRMESFDSFLKDRFTEVTSIRDTAYVPEMSYSFDVTVFDGSPKVLEKRHVEFDREGNDTWKPARHLPLDFDRACLCIANASETMALPVGAKNDWYCLCLDARAHNWVEEHPIFKGPFPVTLTTELRPTPEDAKHYRYFYDEDLPDSTLMWQVQLKGYEDERGVRVGMVSRPWGYTDSPDAEYISSGVCAKTIDAVAIGRHGNFFHWGFAAAPNNLTEEGKQVLANAIVYASKFNGAGILARKPNERIATKEYIKEQKYLASMEPYLERVRWTEESNAEGLAKQAEAKAKKSKGEPLDREEQHYLNFVPQTPMTLEQYLKRYHKNAFDIVGTDLDAYQRYYDENYDYFYGGKGSYVITVDEDCKAWGIANTDIRLLDKAVSCLESGEDVERAQRVLDRYTLCTFSTAKEWRHWLNKYRKKIFFTQSGGWYFMVDGPSTLPGNDYEAKKSRELAAEENEAAAQAALDTPSQANPVCVAGRYVKEEGNNYIELSFAVLDGFHVYRTVSDKDPYIALSIESSAPQWSVELGEPVYPAAHPFGNEGTTVYESAFKVQIPVSGDAVAPVKCAVNWQSCDSKSCTAPQTREFTIMTR